MRIRFIFLLTYVVGTTFAQTTPSTGWKDYKGDAYQIQYPESWQVDQSKAMGTDLLLFSPLEGTTDAFRENVNVMIQNLAGQNIDLDQYKAITENQLKTLATDSEVFESAIIKSGNDRFYRVSYAMAQGQYRLRIKSLCFIRNEVAYLVTFTTEVGTFDKYSAIGDRILTSFKLMVK